MLDPYNRNINYLRISVTERCNLRCTYCMPPGRNLKFMPDHEILTPGEIQNVLQLLVPYGIHKIRLTGGEPLFRPDIVEIVEAIASVPGITDIGLTTNGILLTKYAAKLYAAGLKRVNISLDSLDPEKFAKITSGGDITVVLAAIDRAKSAGFDPVKINCVRSEDFTQEDQSQLEEFCHQNGLVLRFIRQMDLKKGKFWPVEGGDGGNCSICNRLRLTAGGEFKPCLFSDKAYSIREYGIENAFFMAIGNKPKQGTINLINSFSQIGG